MAAQILVKTSDRHQGRRLDVARARNIKPGFYQNDLLAECSVWARLMFPGLWMLADRDGRLEDRPVKIKAQVFPFDNQNVDKLLSELHNKGFIIRYESTEGKCIQIINFRKHQNPHCKEPASTIPAPKTTTCNTGLAPDQSGARTGSEPDAHSSGPADSGSLIPSLLIPDSLDSLEPSSTVTKPTSDPTVMEFPTNGVGSKAWCLLTSKLAEYRESFPGIDVESESRKARQWCIDNPSKRKTPSGMTAFLSRWLGKAQNESRDQNARPVLSNGDAERAEMIRASGEKVRRAQEAFRGNS